MAENRHAVIHFMDGTKVTLKFPKQAGDDPVTILKNVKRALAVGGGLRFMGILHHSGARASGGARQIAIDRRI